MKHTPGPWRVGTFTGSVGNCPSHEALSVFHAAACEGDFGPHICLVAPLTEANDVDEANAHLIAAAPDLYEAVRTFLGPMEDGISFSKAEAHARVNGLRTAMAKAEGR